MKEKKSYNLLITIWLWVVLIGVLPVLGRNLLVSLQFGVGAPADLKFPYTLMILGGVVCFFGYILLLCKRKLGVWLIFLSLPVAYALAKVYLYYFGLPEARSGGLMFVFYVILPLLLNLITAGLLCLRRRGRSGWDLLRNKALVQLESGTDGLDTQAGQVEEHGVEGIGDHDRPDGIDALHEGQEVVQSVEKDRDQEGER